MKKDLQAEIKKHRHSKMLIFALVSGLVFPFILIAKDFYYLQSSGWLDEIDSWMLGMLAISQVLIFPVISGFVITYLLQKEYMDNTVQNIFMAPQERRHFLFAKILLWGIWYLCLLVSFTLVCIGGMWLLYGKDILLTAIPVLTEKIFVLGGLGWLSMFPLLIPAVLQRKMFYPSLFLCAVITVFGATALQMPYSVVRWIPWSAVTVMGVMGVYEVRLFILIAACSASGLAGGSYLLRRQQF